MSLQAPASGQEVINEINKKAVNSTLDGIVQSAYTSGVVQENDSSLLVTVTSLGYYSIVGGMAFLPNGRSVSCISKTQQIYSTTDSNYVYLAEDGLHCRISLPSENFVLLAEISSGGVVTDKREFVRAKIPLCDGDLEIKYSCSFPKVMYPEPNIFTVDLGTNNYRRVFVVVNDGTEGSIGMYDLSDGSYFSTYNVGYRAFWEASTEHVVVVPKHTSGGNSSMGTLTFSMNGNVLTGILENPGQTSASYDFTMIFCQSSIL